MDFVSDTFFFLLQKKKKGHFKMQQFRAKHHLFHLFQVLFTLKFYSLPYKLCLEPSAFQFMGAAYCHSYYFSFKTLQSTRLSFSSSLFISVLDCTLWEALGVHGSKKLRAQLGTHTYTGNIDKIYLFRDNTGATYVINE